MSVNSRMEFSRPLVDKTVIDLVGDDRRSQVGNALHTLRRQEGSVGFAGELMKIPLVRGVMAFLMAWERYWNPSSSCTSTSTGSPQASRMKVG